MSDEKIDVLAVMDAAIMRNGHRGDNPGELAMQKKARAAVAELIAACEPLDELWDAGCEMDDQIQRVAAALARVRSS